MKIPCNQTSCDFPWAEQCQSPPVSCRENDSPAVVSNVARGGSSSITGAFLRGLRGVCPSSFSAEPIPTSPEVVYCQKEYRHTWTGRKARATEQIYLKSRAVHHKVCMPSAILTSSKESRKTLSCPWTLQFSKGHLRPFDRTTVPAVNYAKFAKPDSCA